MAISGRKRPMSLAEDQVRRGISHLTVGGSSVIYRGPLHHGTAYVGFDETKRRFTNYFLCDGVADDVQIQEAVDYASGLGVGSSVEIAGNGNIYDMTSKIIINGVEDFVFKGIGYPVLRFNVAFADYALQVTGIDIYDNVRVTGLRMDGVDKTRGGGLEIVNSNWVRVDNNFIINVEFHIISVVSCYLLNIDHNYLIGAGGANNGINYNGGADSKIKDNEIGYCTDGIYCYGANCNRHSISQNHIWSVTNGFRGNPSEYNLISNNIIEALTGTGIYIVGGARSLISNNRIEKEGPAYTNGIRFDDWARYNHVTGNFIIEANTGIRLVAGAVHNMIFGNFFQACGTVINMASTQNFVRHNKNLITEKAGTATIAAGNTTISVNHGLTLTPVIQDISVTPTNNMGASTKFWISGVGAAQFTINVDIAPGAPTATFVWNIENTHS